MGRRPEVATAPWPVAAVDLGGLASALLSALARVPFRDPLAGAAGLAHNLGVAVTRESLRTFLGYASSLPIDEYRSVEEALDALCGIVLPPVVRGLGVVEKQDEVAGVPGIWYRPGGTTPVGTVLYLHGGGYVGTSPRMYAAFTSWLCRLTRCEVFVADYRLAPEFPFPAGLEDAVLVVEELLHEGREAGRFFVAGDSGGGGLVGTLLLAMERVGHPTPAGALLFSPEVDLRLDQPSLTENAGRDILPWNIPTAAYLHGRDPVGTLSPLSSDVSGWPPTFVAYGGDEMFRDPIRELVGRLGESGVEVLGHEEPGMFHVYPLLMPWADASRRAYAAAARFVADHLPPETVPA